MTLDSADNTTTFRGLSVPAGTMVLVEWTRTDAGAATLDILNNGSVVASVASAGAGKSSSGAITVAIAAGLVSFQNRLAGGSTTSNVQIVATIEPT
jgi:hypothetical protein